MSTEALYNKECAGPSSPIVSAARPARVWRAAAGLLRAWRHRRAQAAARACVLQMDDHLLNDIGAPACLREAAIAARHRQGSRAGWNLHLW